MIGRLKQIGPGALVAAAFIGPGTITTCTLAGASFGYALLWALVFATLATIVLQEMAARLGLVSGKGLGANLRDLLVGNPLKWPLFALIIVAIYLGNGAYEAGNISGAALGIQAITGERETVFRLAVIAVSLLAAGLMSFGAYRQIERLLVGLVMIMAASFTATFFIVRPDIGAFAQGLFVPRLPENSLTIVIALIGTTVVPYNLFLHASAVKSRWQDDGAGDGPDDAMISATLNAARTDTITAIGLGGLITILIVSTAAATVFSTALDQANTIRSASDMARQIEPVFGSLSKYLLGIGFFAAGLSSGITAPLATGYAISEILGLKGGVTARGFRLITLSVIASGAAIALTGIRPVTIILSAQFANGLLLPIIAGFLLFAMNRRALLGRHANGPVANSLGFVIVLITLGLGARSVLRALGVL